MIKRRKDEGFTLIELMIVIAVIGILAVVLVPKVGSIKTQAKSAGIDTNSRTVQAYCQSRINSWVSAATTADVVAADIAAAFTGLNYRLTNPLTAASVDPLTQAVGDDAACNALVVITGGSGADTTTTSLTTTSGTVVVSPTGAGSSGSGAVSSVTIYSHDANGRMMSDKTYTINP